MSSSPASKTSAPRPRRPSSAPEPTAPAAGPADAGRRLTARSVLASTLLGVSPPELPTRSLVATAELLGVAPGTARVAISRMVAAGELEARGDGYRLVGAPLLARQSRQSLSRQGPPSGWDGSWRLLVAPGEARPASERAELRAALAALRFAELREGVWLRPANLPVDVLPDAEALAAARCTSFATEPDEPRALATSLWDLHAWSARRRAAARPGPDRPPPGRGRHRVAGRGLRPVGRGPPPPPVRPPAPGRAHRRRVARSGPAARPPGLRHLVQGHPGRLAPHPARRLSAGPLTAPPQEEPEQAAPREEPERAPPAGRIGTSPPWVRRGWRPRPVPPALGPPAGHRPVAAPASARWPPAAPGWRGGPGAPGCARRRRAGPPRPGAPTAARAPARCRRASATGGTTPAAWR
ncbi:hypothetical protein KSP35_15070 [Aquihabitans sp. G128]|nr:hypothetical protein KSP35_15070 [Aquihabitans sp. G128]